MVDPALLAAIAAIIGAISGAVGSLLPILWSKRKTKADTTKVIEEAASSLIVNLERRVKDLTMEVRELRLENGELSRRVIRLENENEELKNENANMLRKLNELTGKGSAS